MRVYMEYKIISGRVVETRRCLLPASSGDDVERRRAPRVAGKSSLKKIARNEQEQVRRLARIIACNFDTGDLFLTLKYSDARLPESRQAAKKNAEDLLKKLRQIYYKATGKKLRYILCTSDTSTSDGGEARLHHHLIMDRVSYEFLCSLWPADEISYTLLRSYPDRTSLARYILQNSAHEPGKKAWSTSKGLEKPIYTEPEPIPEVEPIKPPKDAIVQENYLHTDADTGLRSAYMRCVLPEKPEVRGGRIIMRRKRE